MKRSHSEVCVPSVLWIMHLEKKKKRINENSSELFNPPVTFFSIPSTLKVKMHPTQQVALTCFAFVVFDAYRIRTEVYIPGGNLI